MQTGRSAYLAAGSKVYQLEMAVPWRAADPLGGGGHL